MKRNIQKALVMSALLSLFTSVQAQVTFDSTAQGGLGDVNTFPDHDQVYTFTDLQNTNPSVAGNFSPTATGTFTAAGSLAGESFTLNMNGWNDYTQADALAAEATFGAYVAGLTDTNVSQTAFALHPDNNGNFFDPGGAISITIDATSLTSGTLQLVSFGMGNFTNNLDDGDFYVWDFETQAFLDTRRIENAAGGSTISYPNIELTTGDILLIAGADDTGDPATFRLNTITFDVVPEPASFGVILGSLALVSLLQRRRR